MSCCMCKYEYVIVCVVACSPDRALLEDSQNFTVLIKNYIEFPKFHQKRYITRQNIKYSIGYRIASDLVQYC